MRLKPLFPQSFTRVLMPIDCTPTSDQAIQMVARFITPHSGAYPTLLAVAPPVPAGLGPVESERLAAARLRHAEETLDRAAAALRQYGIHHRRLVVTSQSTADAIAGLCDSGEYDLLAIGGVLAAKFDGDDDSPCAPRIGDRLFPRLALPAIVLPPTG
jgi:nucleotide-binding universal stress UspA family protein